jgi:predicted dehydrogenase/threonine dehydrogenase-like Zn-dependent dehydrogenase
MLLEFGKANWLDKARQQPDKVRMVLEKVRTDGIAATLEAVNAKLDQPIPIGYCNAGVVIESGASSFAPGDRVVSNGPHAEVVRVPKNLCAVVPRGVSDDAASFTVPGAIALEGLRLAQPSLGECFAVTGLGLIGLITVQLLRAHGCRVLGIDFDPQRLELARRWGAETVDLSQGADPLRAAEAFSGGHGLDGVIVAAATKSNEPVHQAAQMCRKRGRIVLVGVAGLELSRDDFYKKELSFQVSCSYGPGRYDPAYEEKGQDYPIGFVRWTAQRNFEAVLGLMAEGKVDVAPLITHRFPFERAEEAYQLLLSGEPHLGILLEYPEKPEEELRRSTIQISPVRKGTENSDGTVIGLIGTGQQAVRALLPELRKSGARLKTAADQNGVAAARAAAKFGFGAASTDSAGVLADQEIDTVFIATRHDSHARLVCQALEAGKHVFVEKPLAMNFDELASIEAAAAKAPGLLMVGFNRRFAPQVVKMRALLGAVPGPKAFVYTVNAGAIPGDHWTHDPQAGGGRIIGEACHFIDLLRCLAGSPIASVSTVSQAADTVTIALQFEDGSIGSVHYFATGAKAFPKERLEVFAGGRVLQLDNFRRLRGWGWPRFSGMRLWRQDKGNAGCVAAFVEAVRRGGPSPIPFEELVEVHRAAFEAAGTSERVRKSADTAD